MGTEFPWRWGRGTISANLDVIWECRLKSRCRSPRRRGRDPQPAALWSERPVLTGSDAVWAITLRRTIAKLLDWLRHRLA